MEAPWPALNSALLPQEKTESLLKQYDATSHLHSERYARLERAQVLVNQFWETYEELSPWLEETQALIGQLPPPAIDHEHLKQQQEDMRVSGHKGASVRLHAVGKCWVDSAGLRKGPPKFHGFQWDCEQGKQLPLLAFERFCWV